MNFISGNLFRMCRFSFVTTIAWLAFIGPTIAPKTIRADDEKEKKGHEFGLADGKLKLTAPSTWKKLQPRTRIVEFEFAAPASEGDKIDGRITVMGAGGSIEQNVDRWIGQFTQPDGKSTKDRTKIDKKEIGGQQVHIVDITGTFKDQRGPFAPAEMRDDYRMIAAIITTQGLGQYFIKLYGPKGTIAENEKPFLAMLESLKAAK